MAQSTNQISHRKSPIENGVAQLLFVIDTAYDHVSWHGPNLRGSLRGVTLRQAAWRPAPGRHNIWELVVHAAYWKYAAWRRLTGAKRGSFPLSGSNWLTRPIDTSARAWADDLALLDRMHGTLRGAVAELRPGALDRPCLPEGLSGLPSAQKGVTKRALATGVAAHDLYHAGQIQLLKRLSRSGGKRGRDRIARRRIQALQVAR